MHSGVLENHGCTPSMALENAPEPALSDVITPKLPRFYCPNLDGVLLTAFASLHFSPFI
jgi:hypothetical protein